MKIDFDSIKYFGNGTQLTSTGSAQVASVPNTQDSSPAKFLFIQNVTSSGVVYVRGMGSSGSTAATASDLPVTYWGGSVILNVQGQKWLSYIGDTNTANKVNLIPIEA